MTKKTAASDTKERKEQLGKLIAECRGKSVSQRSLAAAVGLPPSNMKYIEDGINAPTADVYSKLIEKLEPDAMKRKKLDELYMEIRQTPPPDICSRLLKDEHLRDAIRKMGEGPLTKNQSVRLAVLLAEFEQENKGEMNHG